MKKAKMLRIGLASLRHPASIGEGVAKIVKTIAECRRKKVRIVCFSELYLPGLRGGEHELPPVDQKQLEHALAQIQACCRKNRVGVIVGMEWKSRLGLENRAIVISPAGRVLGHQCKNQITPDAEEGNYVGDGKRRVFKIDGVPFGIVICHEGWRYPETVRWAAVRGAQIVFHPQWTGSSGRDRRPVRKWGNHFYEMAMICRAQENSIYFASVNQALRFPNSATSLIEPDGTVHSYLPYGTEGLLVADIDLSKATRRYAKRFNPKLYPK
jgi:predicted amidohydrolase